MEDADSVASAGKGGLSRLKVSTEKSDDFLLCSKCIKMSILTKQGGGFSDIIMNTKTVENFFPPGTYDKELSISIALKLHNLPPHDLRTMASHELSIFEHILLYRFWYKILEQCYRRKCHEVLYKDML